LLVLSATEVEDPVVNLVLSEKDRDVAGPVQVREDRIETAGVR
jgi:hypothetical protein